MEGMFSYTAFSLSGMEDADCNSPKAAAHYLTESNMANSITSETMVDTGYVPGKGPANRLALICLAALYFMLGFITCLNDTLVPFFKKSFTLTYAESSLVQFYFFLTYGLFSIPAGRIIERTGYQKGMIIGFLFSAGGSLLFLPAAAYHIYALFLSALFIVALGIVFMQVSANPYIILLGSPDTASSRLNLIQSVGSAGTIAAPLFGAAFILPGLHISLSSDVLVFPYLGICAVLIILSIIIYRLPLPRLQARTSAGALAGLKKTFSFRQLRLGALGIFFFVGIEVAVASFLTNYIVQVLGVTEDRANRYVAFYWAGMLAGRLAGVALLKWIKPSRLLIVHSLFAGALILISVTSEGYLAVWSLVLVGLCNSVLFAIIFSLSVNGLGKYTTQASGILSTAIAGGAVIVLVQGLLIDYFSWAAAFLVPIICYLYIIFYGVNGHKPVRAQFVNTKTDQHGI
jgi:FHS family L-fucose permease-like MFS transporter